MYNFLLILFVFLLVGLGPTFFFQSVYKRNNIFSFLAFSLITGMTLTNLTVLAMGQFGYSITGSSLILIKWILGVSSLLWLGYQVYQSGLWTEFCTNPRPIVKILFQNIHLVDVIVSIPFVLFFGFLFLLNQRYFYPATDHFSFWLADAKIIFTTGHLKTSTDVISLFANSSYYPLHAVYLYESFGYLTEQFATFFTVLYALLATHVAYTFTRQKHFTIKITAALLLILIDLSQFPFILRFYPDIITAFMVAFFGFILLQSVKKEDYYKKVFVGLTTLVVIAMIKNANIVYSFVLFVIFFLFEFKNLKNHLLHSIKKQKFILLSLVYPTTFIFSYLYYFSFIYTPEQVNNRKIAYYVGIIQSPDYTFNQLRIYYEGLITLLQSIDL